MVLRLNPGGLGTGTSFNKFTLLQVRPHARQVVPGFTETAHLNKGRKGSVIDLARPLMFSTVPTA